MKPIKLILCILLCQLAGVVGSIFTFNSIQTWYAYLQKPFFSPPNYAFGPVWIILYTLMGISLYLVLDKKITSIFYIQLALNSIWSIVFFGLREIFVAFAVIILLWISIAFTIKEFYEINKKSAYLLVPYIAWVSVAALLNIYIFLLN